MCHSAPASWKIFQIYISVPVNFHFWSVCNVVNDGYLKNELETYVIIGEKIIQKVVSAVAETTSEYQLPNFQTETLDRPMACVNIHQILKKLALLHSKGISCDLLAT